MMVSTLLMKQPPPKKKNQQQKTPHKTPPDHQYLGITLFQIDLLHVSLKYIYLWKNILFISVGFIQWNEDNIHPVSEYKKFNSLYRDK